MKLTPFGIFLAATAASLTAQVHPDYMRANKCMDIAVDGPSGDEYLLVRPVLLSGATPALTWEDGAGNVLANVALPFDLLGGSDIIHHTTGANGSLSMRFVIGGLDYVSQQPLVRQGVALVVDATVDANGVRGLAIQETQQLGQIDPVKVAYLRSEQSIWIFDYNDRSVRSTSLVGRALPDLLPDANGFQTVLSAANYAPLSTSRSAHTSWFGPWGNGALAFANSLEPNSMMAGTLANGMTSTTPKHRISATDPAYPIGSSYTFQTSAPGNGPHTWELQDDQGGTLATGAVAAAGPTTIASSYFLQPGPHAKLFVRDGNGTIRAGLYVSSNARTEAPRTSAGDFSVGRTITSPLAHLGNTFGGAGVPVTTTGAGQAEGFLVLALADPTGAAPTYSQNGVTLLQGESNSRFVFELADVRNTIGIGFEISADPIHDGQRFYLQYVFLLPDGTAAASDIVGVQARDPNGTGVGGMTASVDDLVIIPGGSTTMPTQALLDEVVSRLQ